MINEVCFLNLSHFFIAFPHSCLLGCFSVDELIVVKKSILARMTAMPLTNEMDLRSYLESTFQRKLSKGTLYRLLKSLGWSWRVPTKFQIHKYSFANLNYYSSYLQFIQTIPLDMLKFADEAHIVSRDLSKKRVLGVIGKRTYTKENTLSQPSASLSLFTSLADENLFFVDYRIASNTQWNFADALLLACKAGFLTKGNFLIIDNAAVHCGMDSYDVIMSILTTFGVTILKMPTYSPELNPCELVFSQMKRFVRNNRSKNNQTTLCYEVLTSLSTIRRDNLYNYYVKCVCPQVILPDFLSF